MEIVMILGQRKRMIKHKSSFSDQFYKKAYELGIDDIGFCSVDNQKISWAKTIIVCCFSYKINMDTPLKTHISNEQIKGKVFSGDLYFGKDYHILAREKMNNLADYMNKHCGFKYEIYCDTGPLIDRELAYMSGIGKYGKNKFILSDKFGSLFYLGYVVTDLKNDLFYSQNDLSGNDLSDDDLSDNDLSNKDTGLACTKTSLLCKNCNNCVISCPYGALNDNNSFLKDNCISYLTQKRGLLTKDEMKKIEGSLFGCHICQQVCPCNEERFLDYSNYNYLYDIEEFLNLSNKQFKQKLENTSAGWIGKTTFTRNGIIVLGNSRNVNAAAIIDKFNESDNKVLSETARLAKEILLESI